MLSRLRPVLAALALAGASALPGQAQTPRVPAEFHLTAYVAGFERPMEVRQSGLRRRIDVASGAVVQTFVADRGRGALTVMTAAGRRRLAFVFPLAREDAMAPLPLDLAQFRDARLTRIGASNVAGRPCAVWRYAGWLGGSGTACATPEGLVLQLKPDGRKTPVFQVLSITFSRQDPKWFAPSPDFQVAAVPGAGGTTPPLPAG
ncbi:MAG TPA: hypothetical protein VD929_00390 [Caulobacteraceae bacterium]|nr:hypothetical protein [Caulobacteraceae bacterium]